MWSSSTLNLSDNDFFKFQNFFLTSLVKVTKPELSPLSYIPLNSACGGLCT